MLTSQREAIQQINKNDFFNLWAGLFVLKYCGSLCVPVCAMLCVFFLFLVISLLLSSEIIESSGLARSLARARCTFTKSHLFVSSKSTAVQCCSGQNEKGSQRKKNKLKSFNRYLKYTLFSH